MNEERLPPKILEWCPPGRSRKGRPRNSWKQEVTTEMREKGIKNLDWVDRKEWRRKNETLYAQKDVKTLIICI